MKANVLTAALFAPVAALTFAVCPAPASAAPFGRLQPATPQIRVSLDEYHDLTFLREEEKLARDVYLTLGAQWNLQIFLNIADSEQTHTEAVLDLLVAYNLPDPVGGQPVGVFSDTVLQQLYFDLVAQGSASLQAALMVGATIEDLDIADLDEMMSHTSKPDLLKVYANLRKGSENHLRAFVGQLQSLGVSYTPQFISAEEFAEIVGASAEAGSADTNRGGGAKGSSAKGSSGKSGGLWGR